MTTTTPTVTPTPLALDKRQRAMLKEIGVRVWSPLVGTAPAAPEPELQVAMESAAVPVIKTEATAVFDTEKPRQAAFSLPSVPSMPPPVPAGASWQFDAAHALFADALPQPGPCWLVLAEASTGPTTADPLDGDAGQLLANMLRAARLAHPGRVVLVPLRRVQRASSEVPASGDAAAPSALEAPLAALVAAHQPDLLLVMGRLAAQALLHTPEPLGKLRGRVHALHGVKTVVTYDAQPLLRTPADKAKAWDDLCLGMATAAAAPAPAAEQGG